MHPYFNSVKPSGPQVENSDVHLILEYDKNESFGTFTAPRANRFIIHADRSVFSIPSNSILMFAQRFRMTLTKNNLS